MFDTSRLFNERLRRSPELAERIRARWSVVYHAVEAIHASEIAEHGADLARPEATSQRPAVTAPEAKRQAVQAAQVGSNIFNLEAYRTRREQTAAEVELIGQQRQVEQARLNAEAALQAGERYDGQLAA
jgi:hypothetical protein